MGKRGTVIRGGDLSKEPLMKGRHPCDCQATRHDLVNNCLSCGKIVCVQEGEGECFFCGSIVSTEHSVMSGDHRTPAEKAAFLKAVDHRNKIVGYQEDKAKRTHVVDDQADYYETESNVWLTEEERKTAKAQVEAREAELHQGRGGAVKWTLDFAGRKVYTDDHAASVDRSDELDPRTAAPPSSSSGVGSSSGAGSGYTQSLSGDTMDNAPVLTGDTARVAGRYKNSTLSGRSLEIYQQLSAMAMRPKASMSGVWAAKAAASADAAVARGSGAEPRVRRVQHASPIEQALREAAAGDVTRIPQGNGGGGGGNRSGNSSSHAAAAGGGGGSGGSVDMRHAGDMGMCLSMHQPWASLLVAGVKVVEGRSWPTTHRGRLWIASTAKPPTDIEVATVEGQYVEIWARKEQAGIGKIPPLPKAYPVAALLGCVTLDDCVPGEELRARDTGGEETECDYGFLCSHPLRLMTPVHVKGDHKIWRLEGKVVSVAQSALSASQTVLQGANDGTGECGDDNDNVALASVDIAPGAPDTSHVLAHPAACASVFTVAQGGRVQVLSDGLVLVRHALSLQTQQAIVDLVRHIGIGKGGFAKPSFGGAKMNLDMMCLGKNWNHLTNQYETIRSSDGAPVPRIPDVLQELVAQASELVTKSVANIPACAADLAVINFYTSSGRLGMHQDKSESDSSLDQGLPVISFSIGDTAEFIYSNHSPSEVEASAGTLRNQSIALHSGDLLVFGGPCRMLWHGVERIRPNTAPRELKMAAGRLNLTFRQE